MIEYAVGPVLALLISLKFADYKSKEDHKKHDAVHAELVASFVALQTQVNTIDREVPKKLIVTLAPVAKAVQDLQEAIGVQ